MSAVPDGACSAASPKRVFCALAFNREPLAPYAVVTRQPAWSEDLSQLQQFNTGRAMMKPWQLLLLVFAWSLATTGCVVRARGPGVAIRAPIVVVAQPPPPVPIETVPPPPADAPGAYVWQPGYWRWSGTAYEWLPGRYERRPSAQAIWVPAKWVPRRDGQWVYRPAHWVYR